MAELKVAISTGNYVITRTVYFVSLPTEESHTCHPTGGGVAGFSKRINERVAAKLQNLWVKVLATEIHEVRRLLRHFVMHDLCKDSHPDPNDRAYFPINNELKNHIYMAKRALHLSCLDQDNLCQKIEQWKITDPESIHIFSTLPHKES